MDKYSIRTPQVGAAVCSRLEPAADSQPIRSRHKTTGRHHSIRLEDLVIIQQLRAVSIVHVRQRDQRPTHARSCIIDSLVHALSTQVYFEGERA